ncbi:mevalonate kinase family protein [Rhodanobacter koreensis]
MMELMASAPGKLVLLGEYAVLEGAPALAVAVDRRATVRIKPRSDGVCVVSAPDIGVFNVPMPVDVDGRLHWHCAEADTTKLRLVDHVWSALSREGLAPPPGDGFCIELDTAGFFETSSSGQAKLGLGSSAALTVALASALAVYAGHAEAIADRAQWLHRLFRMHSSWQEGRGSGVDLAASVAGGLIAYRLSGQDPGPSFTSLDWPVAGVRCLFVWSGQSVSTADFLRQLAQWRLGHHAEYAAHMRNLGELAEVAAVALQEGRGAAFVAIVAAYATALESFGAACGLEIFSATQKRLAELAARTGVSYKPCGAGGDFGVVFVQDADRLARIERSILVEGLHCVPLAVDSQGAYCTRFAA